MADNTGWGFYGRRQELDQLRQILERGRWFFLQISGRRRIGKTTLIQRAIQAAGIEKTLYIQIPDSDPAGVAAVCNGYLARKWLEPIWTSTPSRRCLSKNNCVPWRRSGIH